ncbi:MAG TPA: alpha/beta hydrolase [Caulobacteraceae bacterium]|jgi:acetyl esterase/lipase|nr:alpha/beta hydrolase [Caulobacteraceae bacterium]
MPSRHLVDPELGLFIDQFPSLELDHSSLKATRAMMRETVQASRQPPPPTVEVMEQSVPGPAGSPDVRVMVIRPKARSGAPGPGVLHIHGGGYVLGSVEMAIAGGAAYALELGATVVSVDYRLAPETSHPGPVEDCYAALAWLHAKAEDLGVDRARIAVTGESAGGGLAAGLVLLARDRGEIPVAFQHLIFPMLDDRTAVKPDPSPHVGQFIWTREANRFGWAALLGQDPGGPDISPYAAAARADDLSGLPPTFMICGALDLFVEEDMDYARRLIRAGVPTELHIYPGAPHGFMFAQDAGVSKTFARDSMAALKRALGIG